MKSNIVDWLYKYEPHKLVLFIIIPLTIYILRSKDAINIRGVVMMLFLSIVVHLLYRKYQSMIRISKIKPHSDSDIENLEVDHLISLTDLLDEVASPELKQELTDKIAKKVLKK